MNADYVKNLLTFMKAKGWKLEKATDQHYVMAPPAYVEAAPDFRLLLAHEKFVETPDYEENMYAMTKNMSKLYEVDYLLLINLFSKSLPELKAYNQVTGEMLGVAV
jgi:hypothetical protein